MAYLDANATQPLRPQAKAAVLDALEITGNPASVHGPGRASRRVLEDARETLASQFGVETKGLVFTSGGTEADVLAIHALGANRRIIVSAIEHDAVRAAAADSLQLPAGRDGVVDLTELDAVLRQSGPALVCLMLANNETGVVQPVAQAAAICRRHGAVLHVDAVQAAGRLPVSLTDTGAHSMAISSHKLGGPAGIGALLLASDAPFAGALIPGGGQERGRRGGTPSVSLAAGFAAAACVRDDQQRLGSLRDAAEAAAVTCGAIVCGGDGLRLSNTQRLPNTTCLALAGVRADAQVIALDLEGIAVSAGAACSSGKVTTSHVLAAMGLESLAGQAIRVSLPWNVTEADIEAFAAAYRRVADRLCQALVPHAA